MEKACRSVPGRTALASSQLAQLRQLLSFTAQHNPFYRAKWQAAEVTPELSNLDDLARLPLTNKAELVRDQELAPPFGSNLAYPLERYTRYHHTSGTTGRPLRWLDTPESWDWMVDRWLEIYSAAGVTPSDRIAFTFSFGPFLGFWLAFEAGTRLGALCLPGGGLSSLARVRLMLENQATVLCCTPTYAIRLAEAARAEGIPLRPGCPKTIIVAGEPGGSIPATRALLESLWPGARVFDHHGMTETGPVTFECPARPGFLHVMETGFRAEILDPATGRPVETGAVGELILTNLGRTGSPLIRYRTGDLVNADPSTAQSICACGRPDLALAGGITGRIDDMVIVRGVNIFPSAVEHLLRSCEGVAEYQVRVRREGALTELNVLIEPMPACPDVPALVDRVRKSFQTAFNLRIAVQAVEMGTLPRFEMKAQRWVHDSRL